MESKAEGTKELLGFFSELKEKASFISNVANGTSTVQRLETSLGITVKPRQSPLKSEEDASLQAKDPRYTELIDRAYWLAEAIGEKLAGEK